MLIDRIENLLKLKDYIQYNPEDWQDQKLEAERMNGWFTQAFIEHACKQIVEVFLDEKNIREFSTRFTTAENSSKSYLIGLIMAGNIPLVGFHDFLCVYLSGHPQKIKLSSKDNVLLKHLIQKLIEFDENNRSLISISDMLKACDAYIATGSNNSSSYFEQYFAKYPHIIRRNRTSIAILTGKESEEELQLLADDVYLYFGLGCRNVTKLFVPREYDFIPLINAFRKYDDLKHHNKFRNNIDYNLALYILNNAKYMSNESILLVENKSIFSPISVLNYEYYDEGSIPNVTEEMNSIQAVIGQQFIPFGQSQRPTLSDFADGVNTIDFLNTLV